MKCDPSSPNRTTTQLAAESFLRRLFGRASGSDLPKPTSRMFPEKTAGFFFFRRLDVAPNVGRCSQGAPRRGAIFATNPPRHSPAPARLAERPLPRTTPARSIRPRRATTSKIEHESSFAMNRKLRRFTDLPQARSVPAPQTTHSLAMHRHRCARVHPGVF